MIRKETTTRIYGALNSTHTNMAARQYERTIWYLFGFIPIWRWSTPCKEIYDFSITNKEVEDELKKHLN